MRQAGSIRPSPKAPAQQDTRNVCPHCATGEGLHGQHNVRLIPFNLCSCWKSKKKYYFCIHISYTIYLYDYYYSTMSFFMYLILNILHFHTMDASHVKTFPSESVSSFSNDEQDITPCSLIRSFF